MRIKANGLNFNYTVDGPEGAPWLVFSNSLATTVAMWDEQAAALKGKNRVLRYDQRGHGGTDAPAGRYAFDTLIADAVALMDALGIRKANFAGLSMGGATALGLHVDAAVDPAVGGAHRGGAEGGHGSAGRAHHGTLVPARDAQGQSAASRQGARHDPRHAGQRLHRLRG